MIPGRTGMMGNHLIIFHRLSVSWGKSIFKLYWMHVFVSRWCTTPAPSTYSHRVTTAEVSGSRVSKKVSLYPVLIFSNVCLNHESEMNRGTILKCSDGHLKLLLMHLTIKTIDNIKNGRYIHPSLADLNSATRGTAVFGSSNHRVVRLPFGLDCRVPIIKSRSL